MKKLLVIILSMMFILIACSGEKKEYADGKEYAEGYETARMSNRYSNLNLNGMFYPEDYDGNGFSAQRLWFFDFDSMKSAIMCARPNCQHNDPEVCTSFRMDRFPTVVGNKLYFFRYDSEWDSNGKLHRYQHIYKAELDGSSRIKIDTLEDIDVIHDLVVKGSVAYFTALDEEHEDHTGVNTGYAKAYICSYDFANEKFTNYGLLQDGYNTGAYILGEYNGGLYIRGYYVDEQDGYEKTGEWLRFYLRFDLETGEITDWDMPISSINQYGNTKPMFASGGFYGYMDGDNAVIVDSEGNEMVFENYELPDNITVIPINGYFFNVDDGTAIDLSNGEILEINKKAFPKYGYVLCYHDGSYIIYNQTGGSNFKKVSEDEIFKELNRQ